MALRRHSGRCADEQQGMLDADGVRCGLASRGSSAVSRAASCSDVIEDTPLETAVPGPGDG